MAQHAQTPVTSPPAPAPDGPRPAGRRAWAIAVVAGAAIVTAGAFTTVPGLLVTPLHQEYAWDRGQIALAASVNMVLFGATAPFAAALMERAGIRRVAAGAMLLIAAGALLTNAMASPWQLVLYWGVLIGLGSGCLTMTFAALVTSRWFTRRRGLVTGALSASSHLGQLLFLPLLAWAVDRYDWQPPVVTLALTALTVAGLVALFLRDHPADVGVRPYGSEEFVAKPAPAEGAARRTVTVLVQAMRTGTFWLLAGMFVICGASTNGIMWSNWVPAAHDHGMHATVAASMLSLIGVFSSLGAALSGWLTDRFDPRRLLAVYFTVRALTLLALPLVFTASAQPSMIVFAVVYGLVDVATVPPVIALCQRTYGDDGPIVFGWTNSAHQLGAGASAFLGATARDVFGTYDTVWITLSAVCLVAALLAMVVRASDGDRRLAPEG
ncbi:MFS transporter [Streptomyces tricolor]|uniref:MFS transporter n=1 Tax=unclassified Streptomyces TaxID=2593676 RepID=UPI000B96FB4C|nr:MULTISPECIES: MFS transporter [unclassified Streptomyces]OYP18904.1 MFS transporter [Streptomyces sp. FBKL.4005]BCM71646.1 putative permease of the major facilitator superfamily [Streptomyces sp. EAS-AB2608]